MSSDFIKVYGQDPNSKDLNAKGRKTHFLLHRGLIAQILPRWAVHDGQKFLDASATHPNAKVYWAEIIDTSGNHYSCGDRAEILKLMGTEEFNRFRGKPPEEKGRIGFASTPLGS